MWLIVNLSRTCEAGVDYGIAERGRPTTIYDDKERAERRLMRLEAKYPGNEFALFEMVAKAERHRVRPDVVVIEEVRNDQ